MSFPENQSKSTLDRTPPEPSDQSVQLRPEAENDTDLSQPPFLGVVAGMTLVISLMMFGLGASWAQILGVAVALFVAAASYQYPRQALWVFLIYLPFAGTVTYWIGNDHPTFHFAKDILYFPALIAILIQLKRQGLPLIIPRQLKLPLIFLLAVALTTFIFVNGAQQFSSNPGGEPLKMGIFGLKVLLGYIPLITCGYILIRHRQDLDFFTRLHVILIIICCLLGLIQFGLVVTGVCPDNTGLPEHLLLRANLQRKCFVGGALGYFPQDNFIRLPGTFVAPWQWSWFLISSTFFSIAAAFNDRQWYWRAAGYTALSLTLMNGILCGQRTAMVAVPLIAIILLIASRHIRIWKRLTIITLAGFIFLGGFLFLFPDLATDRFESLVGRWNASPPAAFIAEQAQWISQKHEGFLGHGLGRATNAARALGDTRLIETYYPKLLYEMGPFGVIAFLSVVTSLTLWGFKSYHQLKDQQLWGYGIVFWMFILLISYNSYWYPLDTDPIAVYYWLIAGILFKLQKL